MPSSTVSYMEHEQSNVISQKPDEEALNCEVSINVIIGSGADDSDIPC